jgi:branched-chain amino acid transport system permease protein
MTSTPFILALGAVLAVAAGFLADQPYFASVLAYGLVLGIFALGLALTLGRMGYVTFGHAAFFGLGAYAVALVCIEFGFSYWAVLPLALVPGIVLGVLVGVVSARLGGAYFAIATLTTAEILRLVAANWIELTRGPMGMLVPVPPLPWQEALGWNSAQGYLSLLIAIAAVVLALVHNLNRSPLGRAWVAVREAPDLAESLGIPTVRARVWNVALSGAIASLAGALVLPKIFVVTPDLFGVANSATGLLAAILGGKASLLGPLLGGLVFAVLPEALRFVDAARLAIFAVILLVVVRLLPGGLVSLLPARLRRRSRAPQPDGASPPLFAAASTAATLLEVRGLRKSFAGVTATQDVSFSVRRGELVGLIGPNGAGKTTCFSQLSGFLAPDAGEIVFDGASVIGQAPHRIAARGMVRTFQHAALARNLTVYENVLTATHLALPESVPAAALRLPGVRRREAARAQLALACLAALDLGARADEMAQDLPYGEQKLLAIAMALAARPRLLLLDEPAAGLNQVEAARLAEVLRGLQRAGLTMVVVDHNLKMMMAICDRIVVLHHGALIAQGTPAEVREHPEVVQAYLGEAGT